MPDYVVDGKDNYERKAFLKFIEDVLIRYGRSVVQISRCPVKGSNNIYGYYWGVVINYALEHFSTVDDTEYGQYLHDIYKKKYIPKIYELVQYQMDDDVVYYDYDKGELTTTQFNNDLLWTFVQMVRDELLYDHGVITPDPDKVIRKKVNAKKWKDKNDSQLMF